ncbi:MAG: S41 family peptidase [Planctomycetota bacterium]|nr:S41 family peptidase [Planctomycetota bacterium]
MPTRNIFIILGCLIVSLVCYSEYHKNRYSDTIAEAMTIIETQALKEFSRRELFRAAMRGMVSQIDEHSAFIDGKEKVSEFRESLDQEFGGIGIIVDSDTRDGLTVITPLPGTPAAKAGMQPGDVIVSVNQQPTKNLSRAASIKLIKGPVGESVKIEFRHLGESITQSAEIVRQIVEVPSVKGDYRNSTLNWIFRIEDQQNIGYIRLSTFGEKTVKEMKQALVTINGNVDGLILDLRENPGGLLETAIQLADLFIDEDMIVETRRRDGEVEDRYMATSKLQFDKEIPMVILINGRSASASEIVAACLQDHGRAIVCGERSWGKGTVQNVITMENQKSILKITTASYWRPSGKNIHRSEKTTTEDEWGVVPTPGFEVKLTAEQQFAVLRYRNFRDRKNIGGEVSQKIEKLEDAQLNKAIDYLLSL